MANNNVIENSLINYHNSFNEKQQSKVSFLKLSKHKLFSERDGGNTYSYFVGINMTSPDFRNLISTVALPSLRGGG